MEAYLQLDNQQQVPFLKLPVRLDVRDSLYVSNTMNLVEWEERICETVTHILDVYSGPWALLGAEKMLQQQFFVWLEHTF